MNAAVAMDIRFGELADPRYVFLKKDLAARWDADAAQISRWYNSGTLPAMDVFDASSAPLGWTPVCVAMFEIANPRFRERARRVRPPE